MYAKLCRGQVLEIEFTPREGQNTLSRVIRIYLKSCVKAHSRVERANIYRRRTSAHRFVSNEGQLYSRHERPMPVQIKKGTKHVAAPTEGKKDWDTDRPISRAIHLLKKKPRKRIETH